MPSDPTRRNNYGPQRVSIELANICNLHCNYCLRSEEALYSNYAKFFEVDLLKRVLKDAQEIGGITCVGFTGGEPTLHPQFTEVIETVAADGLTATFVTNGGQFERSWAVMLANPETINHRALSLGGMT